MHAANMSVPSLCGLGRAAAAVATLAAALLVLGMHQHHQRGGGDRGGGLDSGGGGGGAAVVTRVKDGANPRTRTVAERMDSLRLEHRNERLSSNFFPSIKSKHDEKVKFHYKLFKHF